MSDTTQKLRTRLSKIWESPNIFAFLESGKHKPHTIKKRTILFNESDPLERLYFIHDGFIKLYRLSEEGRDTTVYLLGPGSIVGIRTLLSEVRAAKHTAEAMTDVKVTTISFADYLEAAAQNPELLVDLLHLFIERLNYTERKLEGFIFTDTTARVANFLADCAKRFGKEKNAKIVLPLELTHQRIAEFVGSFRETVTLALLYLKNEGIIKTEKGQITILNLKKLQQFALTGRKTSNFS